MIELLLIFLIAVIVFGTIFASKLFLLLILVFFVAAVLGR